MDGCFGADRGTVQRSVAAAQPCYNSTGAGPGLRPVAGHITTAVRLLRACTFTSVVGGWWSWRGPRRQSRMRARRESLNFQSKRRIGLGSRRATGILYRTMCASAFAKQQLSLFITKFLNETRNLCRRRRGELILSRKPPQIWSRH